MGNTTSSAGQASLYLWFFAFISLAAAHTWVEMLTVIAPNGTFIGDPGYPRGNVLRTVSGFGDPLMTNRIPPTERSIELGILPTDPMCMPSQQISNQTTSSPALKASAGDMVALRYQENGHVTLPATQLGKPPNRGTVFVYGTTQPKSDDTLLGIHKVWTSDGKGGDGRGVLLATRNYDDGQCYQMNPGVISTERQAEFKHDAVQPMGGNLWCQTDITLPSSINGNTYTLYWVWDWPTLPGIDPGLPKGKNETYTTCMDIDISSQSGNQKAVSQGGFVKGQNLNFAAVESQLADQFQVPVSGGTTGQPVASQTSSPKAKTSPAGQSVTPQTSSPKAKTSPAAASATKAAGGGGVVVTATKVVPDVVTIYSTVRSSAKPSSTNSVKPVTEGPGGSVVIPAPTPTITSSPTSSTKAAGGPVQVEPFHTSGIDKTSAKQTTLAKVTSKTEKPQPVVTVTKGVEVEATATVFVKATSAPRIRGRAPLL